MYLADSYPKNHHKKQFVDYHFHLILLVHSHLLKHNLVHFQKNRLNLYLILHLLHFLRTELFDEVEDDIFDYKFDIELLILNCLDLPREARYLPNDLKPLNETAILNLGEVFIANDVSKNWPC